MTAPTYARIERAIRAAWSGDVPAAHDAAGDFTDAPVLEALDLLAAAPFAYKNSAASAVRAAWVRAGGVTPLVPTPGISNPIAPAARFPY